MHSQLSAAKLLALFTALTLLCTAPLTAQTLGANFTYQGQLQQGGSPLSATADFEFKLFDALTGGIQIGSTQPVSGVNVVDGLFTVSLDFGSTSFNGNKRWLEIYVRSPAGAGAFTLLTPRQPLAATPYALYALTGPGSGGPWAVSGNDIFNTNTGNVGIGTSTPSMPLHVAAAIPVLVLQDSNSTPADQYGFISLRNASSTENGYLGFGFNLSPDLQIANVRPNGALDLRTQNVSRMTVTSAGNVGIGTTVPAAKLQVVGDVKLGSSGELFAPGGQENLRIIRGIIAEDGGILEGLGFNAQRLAEGHYLVTFNTAFTNEPTITATADRIPFTPGGPGSSAFHVVMTDFVTTSSAEFVVGNVGSSTLQDRTFQFIAIGPR